MVEEEGAGVIYVEDVVGATYTEVVVEGVGAT